MKVTVHPEVFKFADGIVEKIFGTDAWFAGSKERFENAQKLAVKHDRFPENEIVVNGIECTFCQDKVSADMIHSMGDIDLCDACYEGNVA